LGRFGPEKNKLVEGQPNEYDVICRNASVLAFHLWPTIFAGAPFRLENICRTAFHRVPAPLHPRCGQCQQGEGHFWNTSYKTCCSYSLTVTCSQEEQLGCCTLQQSVSGNTTVLFRFPPCVTLPALATLTVWSASGTCDRDSPDVNFRFRELRAWGTGSDYTTALRRANGQVG